MPASPYDPIGSALKDSFIKGGDNQRCSLNAKMEANLQRSLLTTVAYDDPVRLMPSGLKPSYILLNPKTEASSSGSSSETSAGGVHQNQSLDQVPAARVTLFRREQIEIGFSRSGGAGSGMINMGNTCYLNSTLQALFHIPALVNYLRAGGHESECGLLGYSSCTICLLASTYKQTQNTHIIKPIKIYEKLKMICKHLVHGRQEDAHEFLRYLVESLQKCYLLSKHVPKSLDNYSKETTPFNQIFGGYMRQELHCMKCSHVSITFQHFMDLLLDIRNADNIESALGGYFKKEILGQEDMYKCEKCKQKVQACKLYRIERPPLVLCIQLKRFNMMGGKNGRQVVLSRSLDITNFVRWSGQSRVSLKYRLVSLINHVGPSPNCGHYTAVGEAPNGTFFKFDDANVSPTSLQNVLATPAYVIFYEITKQSRDDLLARPARKVESSQRVMVGPQLPSSDHRPATPLVPPPTPQTAARPSLHQNLPRIIQEPQKTSPRLPVVAPKAGQPVIAPKLLPPSGAILPNKLGVLAKPSANQSSPAAGVVQPPRGLVPYGNGNSSSDSEAESSSKTISQKSGQPAVSTPGIQLKSPFLPRAIQVQRIKAKETEASKAVFVKASGKPEESNMETEKSFGESSKSSASTSENAVSSQTRPPAATGSRQPNGDSVTAAVTSGRVRNNSESERHRSLAERLGVTVTDKEAHNPSIHSDNSNGSTHSFTVSDLRATAPSPVSSWCSTSQSWTVSPLAKRERSVPPLPPTRAEELNREDPHSDTELLASPRKRQKFLAEEPRAKKSLLDEMKTKTTETFREIGKGVLTATATIKQQLGIRSNKVTDKLEKLGKTFEDAVSSKDESSTSCLPSTSSLSSTMLIKESDEESDGADDESEEKEGKRKKHKKKKKHKSRSRHHSGSEEWEEKTKENLDKYKKRRSPSPSPLRKSAASSAVPVHKWDSKPDLKQLGRSTTWDGSKGSDLASLLRNSSAVRSWSGDVTSLDQNQEVRKRAADSDDELDKGRVKKVKKNREERHWDHNPFQTAQDMRNKINQSSNFTPLNRNLSGNSHHHHRSSSFDRSYQDRGFGGGGDHARQEKFRYNSFRHEDRYRDKHRNRDHNYHRERPGGDERSRWDYKRKTY